MYIIQVLKKEKRLLLQKYLPKVAVSQIPFLRTAASVAHSFSQLFEHQGSSV